jgi:hypothetical protein
MRQIVVSLSPLETLSVWDNDPWYWFVERYRRWLWRATYLREREAAHEARLAAQLRRHREWLEEAVPYLRQHLATHGERLAEEIEAELAGTPASPEPFPHRARWLDAAADRVAAGELVEQVMADFGWRRA